MPLGREIHVAGGGEMLKRAQVVGRNVEGGEVEA